LQGFIRKSETLKHKNLLHSLLQEPFKQLIINCLQPPIFQKIFKYKSLKTTEHQSKWTKATLLWLPCSHLNKKRILGRVKGFGC